MRVSQDDMKRGHERIVREASALLRERGVRGVSVADLMQAAGLTHGGFYRHFSSKDDLVSTALQAAFDEFLAPLESRTASGRSEEIFEQFSAMYLSAEHVAHPGRGCPMPALATEIPHLSAPPRQSFDAGVRRTIDALAQALEGADARPRAARTLAMLVGAVVLARATEHDTGQAILQACRTT